MSIIETTTFPAIPLIPVVTPPPFPVHRFAYCHGRHRHPVLLRDRRSRCCAQCRLQAQTRLRPTRTRTQEGA